MFDGNVCFIRELFHDCTSHGCSLTITLEIKKNTDCMIVYHIPHTLSIPSTTFPATVSLSLCVPVSTSIHNYSIDRRHSSVYVFFFQYCHSSGHQSSHHLDCSFTSLHSFLLISPLLLHSHSLSSRLVSLLSLLIPPVVLYFFLFPPLDQPASPSPCSSPTLIAESDRVSKDTES